MKNISFLKELKKAQLVLKKSFGKQDRQKAFTIILQIEKKINEFVSSGIEWLPINKILLDKEKTKSVLTFLDTLENDDDVQHVYANLEIDNNFEKKIST